MVSCGRESVKNGHCHPTQILYPRILSPLGPKFKPFPQSLPPQIQCHTMAWSESEWSVCLALAEVHGEAVMGNPAAINADLSLPFPGASQHGCTPQKQSPGFSSLSICPSSSPTGQRGLFPQCRTPALGCPDCSLIC